MQGDGDHPLLGADLAGAEVREQVVGQPHAELGRHRDAERGRRLHGSPHDGPQQIGMGGHRGAAALAGDLGRRAPEVEIDVVGQVTITDQGDGLADDRRVAAVQLQAARMLVGAERHHPAGLVVAVHDRARHHHLVDVHKVGGEAPAQRAERRVGDARHRRQHDRCGRHE